MKSFYSILAIIIVFVGILGAAAFYKNRVGGGNGGPVPGIEVTAEDHVLGNGGRVLVEYSDFQCPACRNYFPIVEELLRQKGSEITFVYRHFPLPQHSNAYPAAQASEAAANQGKFFEMYRKLFEGQDEWANLSVSRAAEVFKKYAQELSLDMAKYETDYALAETRVQISTDYKSGVNLGVNQTPTFFLDGKKINNPQSLDEFIALIGGAPTNIEINLDNTKL